MDRETVKKTLIGNGLVSNETKMVCNWYLKKCCHRKGKKLVNIC